MTRRNLPELDELHEKLPYVVQAKDPCTHGESGEWMTRWELGDHGVITGKSAAYRLLGEMKKQAPHLKWRILKKNEADAYEQGIEVGRRLATSRINARPLMYMPEHL